MSDYNVNVKYNVDSSGLKGAGDQAKALEANLMKASIAGNVIGNAISAGLSKAYDAVRSVIDQMDELSKSAQKAGVSIENMSTLAFVGDQSGVAVQALSKGLRALSQEALAGGDKLKLLGINAKDATGHIKDGDVLLKEVATKFSTYADNGNKAAASMELFGAKVGPELIPLLNGGAKGIEELQQRARDLGLEIDSVSGKSAEDFNDALDQMKGLTRGLANDVAKELLPGLSALSQHLVENGIEARKSSSGFAEGFSWIIKWVLKAGIGIQVFAQIVGTSLAFVVDVVAQVGKAFFNIGGIIASNSKVISAVMKGNFSEAADLAKGFAKDQLKAITDLPGGISRSFGQFKDMVSEAALEGANKISLLDTSFQGVAASATDAADAAGDVDAPNLGKTTKVAKEAKEALSEYAKQLQKVQEISASLSQDSLVEKFAIEVDALGKAGLADQFDAGVQAAQQLGLEILGWTLNAEGTAVVLETKVGTALANNLKVSQALLTQYNAAVAPIIAQAEAQKAVNAETQKAAEARKKAEEITSQFGDKTTAAEMARLEVQAGRIRNEEELTRYMADQAYYADLERQAKEGTLPTDIESLRIAREKAEVAGRALEDTKRKIFEANDEAKKFYNDVTGGFVDTFINGLKTGKMAWKEWLADLASQLLKSYLLKLLAQYLPMLGSAAGSVGPTTTGTINTGANYANYAAKGAWFDGAKTNFFADGGIVNRATSFGMKNGNRGVMGEAGPEAIMPLTRGPNGKLGISAHGGGGTNVINLGDTTINVQSTNDSQRDDRETAKAIDKMLEEKLARWLQNQRRSGNSLNPSFGIRF